MRPLFYLKIFVLTTFLLGPTHLTFGQVEAEAINVQSCSNLVTDEIKTFDPRGDRTANGVWGVYQNGWKVDHSVGSAPVCTQISYESQPLSFFSTPRPADRTNVNDSGVDPANLVPEGIDLSFFPSFPLSSELVLKPSLAYASDGLLERHGALRYGSPKAWRGHYGEIVRMIGRMAHRERELNQSERAGENDMDILSSSEISTYFINAEGQQVNFYVDPSQYNNNNIPNNGVGVSKDFQWYSENGNYRLRQDRTANGTFILASPTGLVFTFQSFKYILDEAHESLSLHYQVTRIKDRYGNYIQIDYEPGGTNRTQSAKAYANGGGSPLYTIGYHYDSRKRLSQITVPGFNGSTNAYDILYPDTVPAEYLPEIAVSACDVTVTNQKAALPSLMDNVNGVWFAGLIGNDLNAIGLYLDADQLETRCQAEMRDLPLGESLDYHRDPAQASTELTTFSATSPIFRITTGSGISSVTENFRLRGNASPLQATPQIDTLTNKIKHQPNMLYRGEFSPVSPMPGLPDLVLLEEPVGFAAGSITDIDIYPIVKDGDYIIGTGGYLAKLQPGPAGSTPDPTQIPLLEENGSPGTQTLFHIREDNMYRIAGIRFPGAPGTTHKLMVIAYDDTTINHGEIGKVLVFDEDESHQTHTAMLATTYGYDRIRTHSTVEDYRRFTNSEGTGFHPFNLGYSPVFGSLPCEMADDRTLDGHDPDSPDDDVVIGLAFDRTMEADFLRKKTTRYALDPTGDLGAPLETWYGGAYYFALAGQDSTRPPVSPEENDERDNGCDYIQWGLDSRPFRFTWRIDPDGSATIFDLSPTGTGLEPVLAHYNDRKRVFKTYTFDTHFKAEIQASNYQSLFFGNEPFYKYYPQYEVGPIPNPDPTLPPLPPPSDPSLFDLVKYAIPSSLAIPTLADLFVMNATKCYKADINLFELTPMRGYYLSVNGYQEGMASPLHLRRETLKSLYGYGVDTQADGTHYRMSAIKALGHVTGLDLDDVQNLFDGAFSSTILIPDITPPPAAWSKGGRTDLGNTFNNYFDRQKVVQLKPHFTFSLLNYGGFDWSGETIDFDPIHFQGGSRKSNGGYLGDGTIDLQAGNQTGPTLEPGDVFYHANVIYTVTNATSGTIAFVPDPIIEFDASEPLSFYRYLNASAPQMIWVQDSYKGYDRHGNNSWAQTYSSEGALATATGWFSTPGFELVPKFNGVGVEADKTVWTDADASENNDPDEWKYFGRVTNSYSITTRRYSIYNDSNVARQSTSGDVTVSSTDFDTTNYPWLPVHSVQYFNPGEISNPAEAIPAVDLVNESIYDKHTDLAYNVATLHDGQRIWERSYVGHMTPAPEDFLATYITYDNHNRPETETQVAVKANAAPYATRKVYSRDDNTGLIKTDTQKTGEADISTQFVGLSGSVNTQRVAVTNYDQLGRVKDTYNERQNTGTVFGPKTYFRYPSQFEAVVTVEKTDTTQLSKQITYRDGRSETVASVNQLGSSADLHMTINTFDAIGRPDKAYSSFTILTLPGFSSGVTLASLLPDDNFSRIKYNRRGEVAGSFTSSDDWSTYAWSFTGQDLDNGQSLIIGIQEDVTYVDVGDGVMEARPRVNFKQQLFDGFGQLVTVQDFTKTPATAPTLVEASDVENYLAGIGDLPFSGSTPGLTALTSADYSFDRAGNVLNVDVTSGSIQSRSFDFDQFSRLRLESHPEMGPDVTYRDFDLYDSPNTIEHGTRRQDWEFNAYGNALQTTYSESGAIRTDTWTYTSASHDFPGILETASATNSAGTVAYRYVYNDDGLLSSRDMVHNFQDAGSPMLSFGYSSNLSWSNAMSLDYRFDDGSAGGDIENLGRVIEVDYPNPDPTTQSSGPRLTYSYENKYGGLITQIDEASLATTPIQNIEYGRENKLTNFQYGIGVANEWYKTNRTFDGLNRLSNQSLSRGNNNVASRDYHFDQAGRIDQVATELGTAVAEGHNYGYDPVGQIVWAELGDKHSFTYSYDGFGNLDLRQHMRTGSATSILDPDLDPDNNQITSGFDYNGFGELETGFLTNQAVDPYTLDYDARGRLASFTRDVDNNDRYFYDAFGMRVLAEKTKAGSTTRTLYFYNENNSALSEWVKEGATEHWDRSYLYLDGKSVFTYEWDEQAADGYDPVENLTTSVVIRGPEPPELLSKDSGSATIRWGRTVGQEHYNMEVARKINGDLEHVLLIEGMKALSHDTGLNPGDYFVRLSVPGGEKGAWNAYAISGPEVVADYSLDGHGHDSSAYGNHGTVTGALTVAGYQGTALRFANGSGQALVSDPTGFPLGSEPRTYMGRVAFDRVSIRGTRTIFDHGPSQDQALNRVRFLYNGSTYTLDLAGFQISASPTVSGSRSSWTHYAITWDGTTWRIYLNGVLKAAQDYNGLSTGLGPLYLGVANPYGTGAAQLLGLYGSLDTISVINRALSASEVYQASIN